MSALRAIKRLGRLREAGFDELKGRGLQEVAKLGERLLGAGVGEMSDAALLAEVDGSFRGRTAEETALIRAFVKTSMPNLPPMYL